MNVYENMYIKGRVEGADISLSLSVYVMRLRKAIN